MRGQPDLFGEIGEIHEDELIQIAWEAALNRAIHERYAIYADYDEYMKQLICKQGGLKPRLE